MKTATVYLVRHGYTWFNRYKRMQGWSDSPLTDRGILEARQCGKLLRGVRFSRVYTSDSMRAQQTTDIILSENLHPDVSIQHSSLFREVFYGSFEGEKSATAWETVGAPFGLKTREEIVGLFGLDGLKNRMHDADPLHDAEDADRFWMRIDRGFSLIRDGICDGDQILVVTHGNTIRNIADRYGKLTGIVADRKPDNGSLTKLVLTETDLTVLSYNQLV